MTTLISPSVFHFFFLTSAKSCPLHSTSPSLSPSSVFSSSVYERSGTNANGGGEAKRRFERRDVGSLSVRHSVVRTLHTHPARILKNSLPRISSVAHSRRAKKGSKLSNCPLKPRARFSAIREAHSARPPASSSVLSFRPKSAVVVSTCDASPSTAESCESATASD